MPKFSDPNLLVGFDTSDDACVYQVSPDLALVQTVDFFPPMVDNPYLFGQIAAANALSDVYAMGGEPRLAMNLLCFPDCLPVEDVAQILEGGYSKVAEAGAIIAGGHSISDPEPKYGLSVCGFVDPKKVLTNTGVRLGDKLILSKPIGTGIMTTAHKGGMVGEAALLPAIKAMTTLNRRAAEIAAGYNIHACTDITGFGLIGHAAEMLGDDQLGLVLEANDLPIVPGTYDMAAMGMIPAGAYRNRDYVAGKVRYHEELDPVFIDIICDPQTSGGLLFVLAADEADALLQELKKELPDAAIIGSVVEGSDILVR